MKTLLAVSMMAASSFAFGGNAMADSYVSYSLTGATFDAFFDGSGGETLSGTWTVDYTTVTVTAVSLFATGPENFSFTNASNVGEEPNFTGTPVVDVQYEIEVNADQGYPYYAFIDYQDSPTVTMLVQSDNGYTSHLHELGLDGQSDVYSPLTGPGVLTETAYTAVPEPATWAMMLVGFGVTGLILRRRGWRDTVGAI